MIPSAHALAQSTQALLDAFGGDTPAWVRDEAMAAEAALEEFNTQQHVESQRQRRDVEGVAFPVRLESPEMCAAVVDRAGERLLYVDCGDAETDHRLAREIVESLNAFSVLPTALLASAQNPRASRVVDHAGLHYPFQVESEEMCAAVVDRLGERMLYVDSGDAMVDEHLARRVVASLNARAPEPAPAPARRASP